MIKIITACPLAFQQPVIHHYERVIKGAVCPLLWPLRPPVWVGVAIELPLATLVALAVLEGGELIPAC